MNDHLPILLILDDEPEVLRSLYDLFRLSYRVETYTRGGEAMAALEGLEDVAVILSDQRMPGMTGVEFLRHAKQLRPDATRLLLTGYADIKAVIDAINEGNVFRYITKPWEPDELIGVVKQAAEHHDLIVERRRLLTELRETNALLVQANRLKEAFIEVASHELNTPVAVILGMTELWKVTRGETASATDLAWLDRLQAAGRRLASTVDRMLKLLQAKQFLPTLAIQAVELEPLVRRVAADQEPFFEARQQVIRVAIEPGLGTAEIDPEKVSDVLVNLLGNAIKFTPDGGTIELAAGPRGDDEVRFRVTDPGIGIPENDRAHLFEPFFTGFDTRHHSSGTIEFGKRGIGLGLCLVKTFVELHGGRVEVLSTPGQGTSFWFSLPRRAAPPGAGDPAALGRVGTSGVGGGRDGVGVDVVPQVTKEGW